MTRGRGLTIRVVVSRAIVSIGQQGENECDHRGNDGHSHYGEVPLVGLAIERDCTESAHLTDENDEQRRD